MAFGCATKEKLLQQYNASWGSTVAAPPKSTNKKVIKQEGITFYTKRYHLLNKKVLPFKQKVSPFKHKGITFFFQYARKVACELQNIQKRKSTPTRIQTTMKGGTQPVVTLPWVVHGYLLQGPAFKLHQSQAHTRYICPKKLFSAFKTFFWSSSVARDNIRSHSWN